jgi:hypothetical protein
MAASAAPPSITVESDGLPSPFLKPSHGTKLDDSQLLAAPLAPSSHHTSTESFHVPPSTDTDRVLKVYQAIERLPAGVRGDGYEEGVELTRERRTASFDMRWEDMAGKRLSVDQRKEDAILAQTDRSASSSSCPSPLHLHAQIRLLQLEHTAHRLGTSSIRTTTRSRL